MSRKIRTARGVSIDMSAMAAKHEMTRAVSNVMMNAGGDRLNKDGTVKVKAEDIAVAHQNNKVPPQTQALSDTKPVQPNPVAKPQPQPEPVAPTQEVEVPDLEQEFENPEPISKITRTRDDGTKYVEIEYDDGSIETVELKEDNA